MAEHRCTGKAPRRPTGCTSEHKVLYPVINPISRHPPSDWANSGSLTWTSAASSSSCLTCALWEGDALLVRELDIHFLLCKLDSLTVLWVSDPLVPNRVSPRAVSDAVVAQ